MHIEILDSACEVVESSWNVMARGDARERKWRANWRMEWVASTLHTTSEHGVSSITTADAHTSAASSRLNKRPCRFKWTRSFRRKTKSGFCACAITFKTQSATGSAYLRLSRVYILQIRPTFSWKLYQWPIKCHWMALKFGAHSIIVLLWVTAQRVAQFSTTSRRKPEITHSRSVFLFPSSDVLSGLLVWSSAWSHSQGISRWNNF
jgi:hypothetical protein